MPNLFIFTVGKEGHLEQSVRQPIQRDLVLNAFDGEDLNVLLTIEKNGPGFYAWGAAPGRQNEPRWNRMAPGDWVLCVYENAYHYVARVLGKFRNANFARGVWGNDSEGQTWEFVYFLSKPIEVNVPVAFVASALNQGYQGFTRISDEKVQQIVQDYGSIESFLEQKILKLGRLDLRSAEVLRALHDVYQKDRPYPEWWEKLSRFLDDISKADELERGSSTFQHKLWEENPVSSVGQGNIPIDPALADEGFRKWLAAISLEQIPKDVTQGLDRLKELRDGIEERLKPYCSRTPHLKIFRVLTALFPGHFTTVADREKLGQLHSAMFGDDGGGSIKRHASILSRLEEVLGPTPTDVPGLVRRITFPWYLYEKLQEGAVPKLETSQQGDPLSELADALLIDRTYLATIKTLLERKNQVILYGPPGTGKTYIARQLATFLAETDERLEIVQFHPSYAYEDFVEGLRPSLVGGGFALRDGPLKRIAERASSNNKTHVLMIDEVNRGNVTKVFGELYYLLEYRNQEICLAYSDKRFKLPKNLWIIGTMNTADRSIALMDAALRRRFYFVDFFPDTPPIQGLLQRWLEREKPDFLWLADVVDRVNRNLGDRHIAIGPSYFMDPNLSEDWIRIIWKYSIMPYLEEHFFGQEERLKDFELEKLRQAATG